MNKVFALGKGGEYVGLCVFFTDKFGTMKLTLKIHGEGSKDFFVLAGPSIKHDVDRLLRKLSDELGLEYRSGENVENFILRYWEIKDIINYI